MSITLVISVLGIVVAAFIALSVAYMQRKQMRQIEAFRLDPKVGLIPPPHPIGKFWDRYWGLIISSVVPVGWNVWELFQHGAVTRLDVVIISTNIGVLVIAIVMEVIRSYVRILMKAFVDGYNGILYTKD
jgi:ABC-type arginine/histidine transport system permease subunit